MKKFEQLGKSLSKQDQKIILAGYAAKDGLCKITVTHLTINWWTESYSIQISVTGSCSSHSAQANSYCVDQIEGGALRCKYDCGCDGYGV